MNEILNTSGSIIQANDIDDYKKLQKTYEDARIKLEKFEEKLKFNNTKQSNGTFDDLNRILELKEERFQMELKQLDASIKKDIEEEQRVESDLKKWKSKTTDTDTDTERK